MQLKLKDKRNEAATVESFAECGTYPEVWDAAWDAVIDAAWDAVIDAARDAIIDAAGNAARDAARDAIMALIAWDDCAHYLAMSSAKLEIWAKLSEKPECLLLLPAVKAFEKIDEMELTA